MHVHLPKPLHGWREFVGEVGIIVIGVLIALGAEQLIESWHWKHEAKDAARAIERELSADDGVYEERALIQKCADRRIEQLAQILRAAGRTHRLPNIGEIGRPPFRPTLRSAWEEAIASGVLSHLDQKRREGLSPIYAQASTYDEKVGEEQLGWSALRMMEEAPGPISDTTLTELSRTLAQLRYQTFMNGVIAQQLQGYLPQQGIRPSYILIFDREARREEMVQSARQRSFCKPLPVEEP
jgi:hypothetical protein